MCYRNQILIANYKKDNLSILDCFDKIKALVNELTTIGRVVDEQDLIILILRWLNPHFNPCICSINCGDMFIDETKRQIFAYENRLIQKNKNEDNYLYQENYI